MILQRQVGKVSEVEGLGGRIISPTDFNRQTVSLKRAIMFKEMESKVGLTREELERFERLEELKENLFDALWELNWYMLGHNGISPEEYLRLRQEIMNEAIEDSGIGGSYVL